MGFVTRLNATIKRKLLAAPHWLCETCGAKAFATDEGELVCPNECEVV